MAKCRYCERDIDSPCMGTRCMEDRKTQICFDALMRAGGGEYTVNREESSRREMAFDKWSKRVL